MADVCNASICHRFFLVFGLLVFMMSSCNREHSSKIKLDKNYVEFYEKRLDLYKKSIHTLKQVAKNKYQNIQFAKRVKKLNSFYENAQKELDELKLSKTLKDKREFEIEYNNMETVWHYISSNYDVLETGQKL
ncbi:MAG: hypothetical protein H6620_05490 [Halobacteriovoraceae bacterium]|nr:hypothetical protein [Halobacteriovoraceae bacterium]